MSDTVSPGFPLGLRPQTLQDETQSSPMGREISFPMLAQTFAPSEQDRCTQLEVAGNTPRRGCRDGQLFSQTTAPEKATFVEKSPFRLLELSFTTAYGES